MRLIVIKLYTMYNFLKIKNNSKLLHIYFPLFLVEHSARVSRFLKHIKVNLRKKKNPHTNLVLKYLKINALKEKNLSSHSWVDQCVGFFDWFCDIFLFWGNKNTNQFDSETSFLHVGQL